MTNELKNLKSSIPAIETVNLYSQSTASFLHKEDDNGEINFVIPMIDNHCFNTPGFAYFKNSAGHFFICNDDNFIAIMKLQEEASFNKVLMEHKIAQFLSEIT